MEFVDLSRQYEKYKNDIDSRLNNVLSHARFIMGPEIGELEGTLSGYVGTTFCLTVSSGTTSLEIALRALDVGPGDEVVTVPFTWISSAEVIKLVGARPVFVDISPTDYNMNAELLEKAVTSKTKAVIAVSLFGQMPNIERLSEITDRHGIALIEDAAQSFGATRNGRKSCGSSLVASTSFFPAKPFGCYGDGGALFTSNATLAQRMKAIRNHGGQVRHEHHFVGTNGRFDTLQAAVLLAKFPHFEAELEARRNLANRYDTLLSKECSIPKISEGNTHVYAQYTVRHPDRDRLGAELKKRGIPTAIYYPKCLHEQPVFADLGYRWGDFPVSENASREVLSLPMHPFLGQDDQDRVINDVNALLKL